MRFVIETHDTPRPRVAGGSRVFVLFLQMLTSATPKFYPTNIQFAASGVLLAVVLFEHKWDAYPKLQNDVVTYKGPAICGVGCCFVLVDAFLQTVVKH